MPRDTARRWKHRRVICVAANKRDEANAIVLGFKPSWGPDFFSIPFANKVGGAIKEFAADVVLSDEMLAQLATLPASVLKPADIETPKTKVKGKARLQEVADKRNVDLKGA